MIFQKVILIGAVLMGSTAAFAYPVVGDKVEFSGTFKQDPGAEVPLNLKMEVLSFDGTEQEWIVREETTIDGKTKVSNEDIDAKDMFTPAKVQYVLTNCEARGGVIENVTVPAGTFSACHLVRADSEESKELWIGDVPFGVLKMISHDMEDGEHFAVELQSFTAAQ